MIKYNRFKITYCTTYTVTYTVFSLENVALFGILDVFFLLALVALLVGYMHIPITIHARVVVELTTSYTFYVMCEIMMHSVANVTACQALVHVNSVINVFSIFIWIEFLFTSTFYSSLSEKFLNWLTFSIFQKSAYLEERIFFRAFMIQPVGVTKPLRQRIRMLFVCFFSGRSTLATPLYVRNTQNKKYHRSGGEMANCFRMEISTQRQHQTVKFRCLTNAFTFFPTWEYHGLYSISSV